MEPNNNETRPVEELPEAIREEILKLYYKDNLTMNQIADQLKIDRKMAFDYLHGKFPKFGPSLKTLKNMAKGLNFDVFFTKSKKK